MARVISLLSLLPSCIFAVVPDYPDPQYTYDSDAGSTCGWLELIAYRFNLDSLAAPDVAAHVEKMVMSVPEEKFEWLRVGTPLRDTIIAKIKQDSKTCSDFTARPDAFAAYPWQLAESPNINGQTDTENHKIMYNNSFLEVVNVHADVEEQYHSHRKLSFFIAWGIDICQDEHRYDGKVFHAGAPDCMDTYNATMPKQLLVIFMSSEWLHANHLWKSMALPEAMNCRHELAPDRCNGYLTRFVFHDDAPQRLYPSDPMRGSGSPVLV